VLYAASGRRVRTLVDTSLGAGRHRIPWDGHDDGGLPVASGVYYLRIDTGGRVLRDKLVLIR